MHQTAPAYNYQDCVQHDVAIWLTERHFPKYNKV